MTLEQREKARAAIPDDDDLPAATTRGELAEVQQRRITLDRRLIQVERAFTDPAGLDRRPWYRHLIFAPKYTYAPELLPGIAEAIDERNPQRVAQEVRRLTAAIRRAAAAMR